MLTGDTNMEVMDFYAASSKYFVFRTIEKCREHNSLLRPRTKTYLFLFLPTREWELLTLEITQETEMAKVAAS